MQPCFDKLWAFMQTNKACEEACLAVQFCQNWDELCTYPQAGDWAIWVWEWLDSQARQPYKQGCEQARQAYKQGREQARQAYKLARQAYKQAAIQVVRQHFEPIAETDRKLEDSENELNRTRPSDE